ncbi:MAG: menaquinone biosynthesis protein [Candidatus Poseidoniaceae archaeon]|jgi:chorismate dehydratase|nr:menaquinone biosynthesis protein [Candidatus Poseidoniaceae archaeon]
MVVQNSKRLLQFNESWKQTIARVAFLNCDPLFHSIDSPWKVLAAPPSWLTGHLLRRDCVLAPIPSADYAKNHDELILIPELGICSKGEVGSVLLFGNSNVNEMSSIALPSDSSSSIALLKYILKFSNLSPKFKTMAPEIEPMLDECDGALLIGDRALEYARKFPNKVKLDLGKSWLENTGKPMVFGVFAARKDTPVLEVKAAQKELLKSLNLFESNAEYRNSVIVKAMEKSGLPRSRLEKYFGEVFNRLDKPHIEGLNEFLSKACNLSEGAEFLE